MAASLDDLRQTLRRLEKATLVAEASACFTFGIEPLDAALGGGIAGGALHEIAAARDCMVPAATGFALALAGQASRPRDPSSGAKVSGAKAVAWVTEDFAQMEHGFPYAPGLDDLGLPPERLIVVTAARSRDVLWGMEEALHCAAIGAVIGEMRPGERGIEPVASRRLSLAAAAHGSLALLLRASPGDEPSAAATRWEIGTAPAAFDPHGLGPPRLAAHLRRNRRGQVGHFILEWHRAEQRFILAANPQPLAAPAGDRPHYAA